MHQLNARKLISNDSLMCNITEWLYLTRVLMPPCAFPNIKLKVEVNSIQTLQNAACPFQVLSFSPHFIFKTIF